MKEQKLNWIMSPSSTPVTIDAKLSSNKIMSAACLLTSDPAIPMATPEIEKESFVEQV